MSCLLHSVVLVLSSDPKLMTLRGKTANAKVLLQIEVKHFLVIRHVSALSLPYLRVARQEDDELSQVQRTDRICHAFQE